MKVVLITGANKGIGWETAKQMAELGYYVYIGSRDNRKGLDALAKLKALGLANVGNIEIDITSINSIMSARQELEKLDILINNAGIVGELPQNISMCNIEILRNVFETNFFGTVQTTQVFLDLLKNSDEPRIVNISSNLGSLSDHSSSQNQNQAIYDAYSCSKAALNAFTVLLMKEFKNTNFKINSVAPGYTATDMTQFKGAQTVEQAAITIVKYATLENDGPSGKYFDKVGEVPW